MILPSLELNWLRTEKDILMPSIVFEDIFVGGCYCSPKEDEAYINGKYYPLDNGILVISENYTDDFVINAIAHEWRHHWQWWHGIEDDYKGLNQNLPYKKMIVKYFSESSTEMDALLFSNKMYPCDDTLEWYEWLVKK